MFIFPVLFLVIIKFFLVYFLSLNFKIFCLFCWICYSFNPLRTTLFSEIPSVIGLNFYISDPSGCQPLDLASRPCCLFLHSQVRSYKEFVLLQRLATLVLYLRGGYRISSREGGFFGTKHSGIRNKTLGERKKTKKKIVTELT